MSEQATTATTEEVTQAMTLVVNEATTVSEHAPTATTEEVTEAPMQVANEATAVSEQATTQVVKAEQVNKVTLKDPIVAGVRTQALNKNIERPTLTPVRVKTGNLQVRRETTLSPTTTVVVEKEIVTSTAEPLLASTSATPAVQQELATNSIESPAPIWFFIVLGLVAFSVIVIGLVWFRRRRGNSSA